MYLYHELSPVLVLCKILETANWLVIAFALLKLWPKMTLPPAPGPSPKGPELL